VVVEKEVEKSKSRNILWIEQSFFYPIGPPQKGSNDNHHNRIVIIIMDYYYYAAAADDDNADRGGSQSER
jgi:hypothetical protein